MFIEHITIWKCVKCPRKCELTTRDRAHPSICIYNTHGTLKWELHEPKDKEKQDV